CCNARPLEHVAIFVRPVNDLVFSGKRTNLRFAEFRTTLLSQVTEGNQLHAMARRTDFLVDLIAALKLCLVELAERAGEGPALKRRLQFRIARRLCRHSDRNCSDGKCKSDYPHDQALAPAASSLPSTDSVMLEGSGFGLSSNPTIGMTSRKCAK